jgi:serine protease 16
MYVYTLAQQHNALLVNVEHRFYGQSYPTLNMTTENLEYLSSQQALADLARIINYLRKMYKAEDSKIITVGGSYPGNLAAWFKLKYPHVVIGSIASSAPLTSDLDFSEYMDVVGESIIYFSGQKCYDTFEKAALKIADLASGGVNSKGWQTLQYDFKTCSAMASEADLSILLSDLMGNIQGTVQYNNEHNGVMNITDICATMNGGTDPYTQFVALAAQYRAQSGLTCEDASWNDYIDIISNSSYNPSNNMRPWTYQTCNEFGYYQTTNSKVSDSCSIASCLLLF